MNTGDVGLAIFGIIVGTIIGEKWHPWSWGWTLAKLWTWKLLARIGIR